MFQMRRFLSIGLSCLIFFAFSCNKNPDTNLNNTIDKLPAELGFVYTSGKDFKVNDKPFFPFEILKESIYTLEKKNMKTQMYLKAIARTAH
jgi:hypothetical protein